MPVERNVQLDPNVLFRRENVELLRLSSAKARRAMISMSSVQAQFRTTGTFKLVVMLAFEARHEGYDILSDRIGHLPGRHTRAEKIPSPTPCA
jgi:hypothetical protein